MDTVRVNHGETYTLPDTEFTPTTGKGFAYWLVNGVRSYEGEPTVTVAVSDMLGGKTAGIATCWFNPKGNEPAGDWDYTVARLEDFLSIVEEVSSD